MRFLLDKVTVRYILRGSWKLIQSQTPTPDEQTALHFYLSMPHQGNQVFIAPSTANVLRNVSNVQQYAVVIEMFLNNVDVIYPGRYCTRWARRLRNLSFGREDAEMLALATFGVDLPKRQPVLDALLTFDQPMITNWRTNHAIIEAKLTAMHYDLPLLYKQIHLPQVIRPDDLLRASINP